ncbi:hypothetical protein CMUS01_00590 [Colletotrichum musicola]|uniref:2EXR domain-containing protein n=1 Tax=Colletotrichum musicola TaxID=2175873 RepID=A0A8H6NYK7_9PEZI|nr:hypothetical protein CMUS01_00590 [Colletotrichum musicola]
MTPDDRFHPFSRLPLELRRSIWLEALRVPTIITIEERCNSTGWFPTTTTTTTTTVFPPAAAQSCWEAYEIFKKSTETISKPVEGKIWAKPAECIICFKGFLELGEGHRISDFVLQHDITRFAIRFPGKKLWDRAFCLMDRLVAPDESSSARRLLLVCETETLPVSEINLLVIDELAKDTDCQCLRYSPKTNAQAKRSSPTGPIDFPIVKSTTTCSQKARISDIRACIKVGTYHWFRGAHQYTANTEQFALFISGDWDDVVNRSQSGATAYGRDGTGREELPEQSLRRPASPTLGLRPLG